VQRTRVLYLFNYLSPAAGHRKVILVCDWLKLGYFQHVKQETYHEMRIPKRDVNVCHLYTYLRLFIDIH